MFDIHKQSYFFFYRKLDEINEYNGKKYIDHMSIEGPCKSFATLFDFHFFDFPFIQGTKDSRYKIKLNVFRIRSR